MYEAHWGLAKAPFDESHAAESFVDTEALALARAKLRYALAHGQGAAAIVGPAGLGTSALVWRFLRERVAEGWLCSYIVHPIGEPREILSAIAGDLGGAGEHPMAAVEAAVLALDAQGRRACVAVDEIHTLRDTALLEGLRMLLNVEVEGRRALGLLLVGQEGLPHVLHSASRLDQRLALTVEIRPFDREESKRYILTRLKASGASRGIFTRAAAELLCALASGIPRHINRLSEIALVTGYGLGADKVDEEIIRMAALDLGLLKVPVLASMLDRSSVRAAAPEERPKEFPAPDVLAELCREESGKGSAGGGADEEVLAGVAGGGTGLEDVLASV
ncbi:MAG: AAA family ATPase [Planctomycetota bacterium]